MNPAAWVETVKDRLLLAKEVVEAVAVPLRLKSMLVVLAFTVTLEGISMLRLPLLQVLPLRVTVIFERVVTASLRADSNRAWNSLAVAVTRLFSIRRVNDGTAMEMNMANTASVTMSSIKVKPLTLLFRGSVWQAACCPWHKAWCWLWIHWDSEILPSRPALVCCKGDEWFKYRYGWLSSSQGAFRRWNPVPVPGD